MIVIITMINVKQELDEKVMEGLTSALLMLSTNNSPRWLISIKIIILILM